MTRIRAALIQAGNVIDFDAKGVTNFYEDTADLGYANWERVTGLHTVAKIERVCGQSHTSRRRNSYILITLNGGRAVKVSNQASFKLA